MKKPNILFLLTDDQRYDAIHAIGDPQVITPNMDALVERGTTFLNAHIPGGHCGAVCMPSRAMIHTGRTPFHLEGEGQNIPEEHVTLGETLKAAGYYCYGTGKWHNGTRSCARSFNDGDNFFFSGMWDHWNVPACSYNPLGEYGEKKKFTVGFMNDNRTMEVFCEKIAPGVHSSRLLTDTSIQFLEKYDRKQPFFLYQAFMAPHDPRTMPEEFKKMYDPDQIKLPSSFMEEHPFDFGVSGIRDEMLASCPRSKEEVRKHLAEYFGMITHLDFELGRLMKTLEQRGLLEDTIIILAGDNGLALGNHGLMGKQNNYEDSIRVPLVMAGPGIPGNVKCQQLVYLLDIYPTLCDMLKLPVPESVEGVSFLPAFTDPGYVVREDLYFLYGNLIRSVKDDKYKLIEYRNGNRRTQLFNWREDPDELKDLSEMSMYSDVKKKLKRRMQEYRKEWEDESHPLGREFWDAF